MGGYLWILNSEEFVEHQNTTGTSCVEWLEVKMSGSGILCSSPSQHCSGCGFGEAAGGVKLCGIRLPETEGGAVYMVVTHKHNNISYSIYSIASIMCYCPSVYLHTELDLR